MQLKDFFKLGKPEPDAQEYRYCMFAGWAAETEAHLAELGVDAEYCESPTDRRIWRLPSAQVHMLPHDNGVPYVGWADRGFALWDMTDGQAEAMRRDYRYGEWTPVQRPAPAP